MRPLRSELRSRHAVYWYVDVRAIFWFTPVMHLCLMTQRITVSLLSPVAQKERKRYLNPKQFNHSSNNLNPRASTLERSVLAALPSKLQAWLRAEKSLVILALQRNLMTINIARIGLLCRTRSSLLEGILPLESADEIALVRLWNLVWKLLNCYRERKNEMKSVAQCFYPRLLPPDPD